MAHKITYPIVLDSGITISEMHCFPVPNLNNLDLGKVAFDLRFYKSRESLYQGLSRIYPVMNGQMISSFIKQLTQETVISTAGMSTKTFNTWIRDYLISIYGYWNVYEMDYEDIESFQLTNLTPSHNIEIGQLFGETYKLVSITCSNNSNVVVKIETNESTPKLLFEGVLNDTVDLTRYVSGYVDDVYEQVYNTDTGIYDNVLITPSHNTYSLLEQSVGMVITVLSEETESFSLDCKIRKSIL